MKRAKKRAKKPLDQAQPPVSIKAVIGKDGRVVHVGDVRIRKLLPVLSKMQEHIDAVAANLTRIIVSTAGRDPPKGESTGTRLTLKELAAVGKLSAKLATQLQLLHKESYDALTARLSEEMSLDVKTMRFDRHRIDYPIEFLRSKLVALSSGASEISVVVANSKMIHAPRGSRPKHEAARITEAAATVFELLTGQRVARRTERNPTGHFPLFLKEVFKVAGIPINVDEQIRGWIANQRASASRRQSDETAYFLDVGGKTQ
jgi:hypothetical protein